MNRPLKKTYEVHIYVLVKAHDEKEVMKKVVRIHKKGYVNIKGYSIKQK